MLRDCHPGGQVELRMFTGFMDDDSYDCGPLSVRQVRAFEARQGFELPSSYVSILAARNGGVPRETFCPTEFPTSWSPEGFEIDAILGIGRGEWSIDGEQGSDYLIHEWGYPEIGVVICSTPSGGHDAVMLDYSSATAEPTVAYVDEDRLPRTVASCFADFLAKLT